MRKILLFVIALLSISFTQASTKDGYYGLPLKYVTGYEVDLNLDKQNDLVFLLETSEGYMLTVLMHIKSGYKTYTLMRSKEKVIVTCKYGKSITSTEAGPGKGNARTYEIPGPYIEVSQPESSSSVYYWKDGKFILVWTSD